MIIFQNPSRQCSKRVPKISHSLYHCPGLEIGWISFLWLGQWTWSNMVWRAPSDQLQERKIDPESKWGSHAQLLASRWKKPYVKEFSVDDQQGKRSYKSEEPNSKNEFGRHFFPRVSRQELGQADTLISALWCPGQRTHSYCDRLMPLQSCEPKNESCFKPQSLW